MRRASFLLALAACAATSGCAFFNGLPGPRYETDQARMAAIERATQRNGVGLVWVNPPTRKVPGT